MNEVLRLRHEATRLQAKADAIEDGTHGLFRQKRVRTPDDLARLLDLTAQAANNRLAKLYRLSYLTRERGKVPGGGRCYIYTASDEFVSLGHDR